MKIIALIPAIAAVLATPAAAAAIRQSMVPAYDGQNAPAGCQTKVGIGRWDNWSESDAWFVCEGTEESIVPPDCHVSRRFTPDGESPQRFEVQCEKPDRSELRHQTPLVFKGEAPQGCTLEPQGAYPGAHFFRAFYECMGPIAANELNLPRLCDVQERSDSGAVVVIKCPDYQATLTNAEIKKLPLDNPGRRLRPTGQGSTCGAPILDPKNPDVEYRKCSGSKLSISTGCIAITTEVEAEFFTKCPSVF